jgi:hypothetical protein
MLTNDVRFEGFTSRDWERFLALWKPRAAPTREASRRRGGLLVVHDGTVVRKVIHSERGRRVPGQAWPIDPAQLAESERASWVCMAKDGAIEAFMDRWAERTKRGDDLTAQLLTFAGIGEELLAEGRLELWPHRLAGLRAPTEAMVHKALDIVCPDGKSLLLGVFHDGDLDTSMLLRRRGKGFDLFAGPDELRPHLGHMSGDWRRDYRHLARAAEVRYGELHLGVFVDRDVFLALQTDGSAGAWARAVAVRDVIVTPLPAVVALGLAADAARVLLGPMMRTLPRVDPTGLGEPAMAKIGVSLGKLLGVGKLEGGLGFDPLEALRLVLRRDD